MSNQEKVREVFMQRQAIDKAIQQLEKQLQALAQEETENEFVVQSLSSLANAKEGDDIICPIAQGVFVKAKLGHPNEILVEVGAGCVVTKSLSAAKNAIAQRGGKTEGVRDRLVKHVQELHSKRMALDKQLHVLVNEDV